MRQTRPRAAFRYATTWELPAPPGRVFAVLSDLWAYPTWWPQVRGVELLEDRTVRVEVSSFLPRTLHVSLLPRTADELTGRLGIWVTGEMQGWAQWLLSPGPEPNCTVARYHHEVMTPGSRGSATILRGPMWVNHGWLFREGHRGLRRHLAGTPG